MALILDKTEQKIVDIIDAHTATRSSHSPKISTPMQSWVIKIQNCRKFASFMKKIWVLRQRKNWLSPVSKLT